MKISVIVPVYNVEEYIDKCLNSLVNQTLKDIEIIVVNDGSKDNSQKIIDDYVKKYPEKVKSFVKENGGQGSARNLGLDKSSGEYISFVDSDDWLELGALEEMYKTATKSNSDIVICDMMFHYGNKTEYKNCTKYESVYQVTPSACNKLFKRSVIGNTKFMTKLWYEDLNFTAKILLNNPKITNISKPYYNCNCRQGSTMNNNNSIKNLDMLVIIDDLIKYAKDNNKYDKDMFSFLIFNHVLITSINRVAVQKADETKQVIKKLRNYCKVNIPDYKTMNFYKNISKNRKIIAWLNYNGLHNISKLLLNIKTKLKG